MEDRDFWIALLIGIIEGLTEFLPVSSTGHMILASHLVDFEGPRAASFQVFIQLGAICAILVLYFNRFLSLLKPQADNKFGGISGIVILGMACLPALVAGFFLHGYIKEYLFSPLTVCLALIIGGIVMIAIEKIGLKGKVADLDSISAKQALMIGFFQTLALWPGVSRSASTIIGGMVCGLDRRTAAEFSFIVAVPIMFAATLWDLYKSIGVLNLSTDLAFFSLGFVIAFVSAMVAVKSFIAFVQRYTLIGFGFYRIVLGAIYLAFIV